MTREPLYLEFDLGDLERLPKVVQKALPIALEIVAIALQSEMIFEAPAATGRLRSSINFPRQFGPLAFGIKVGAEYWAYVQFGTGLHGPEHRAYDIFPVNRKALKFVVGGQTVFSKYVKDHPGMKPNPFVDRAIENVEPKIPSAVSQALAEVF